MEQQEEIRAFESKLEAAVKKMMADGAWPDSPWWPLMKYAVTLKILKGTNINVDFDASYHEAIRLSKYFPFRHYGFLLFLNRLHNFRKLFRRYHKLDGLKFWNRRTANMHEIMRNYQVLKVYEPETTKLVKQYVHRGDVCVDIGASIGYFTLQFARLVGKNGTVIAIEPTDFQQKHLARNIKANGYEDRVKRFMVGAWDRDEIVKQPRNAPPTAQTELRCRPIDDLLEELGITKVDFIKIDTDGAEPWVLRGLLRTIERSPNLKIVLEYYPKYVEDAGGSMEDIDKILNKYFNVEEIKGDYQDGCWNLFCTRKTRYIDGTGGV